MNTRRKISLANRVLSLADKARALYQKKDEAFAQLLHACPAGEIIDTKSGRFEIIDNFAARNVGYRPASFHRFELKEVKSAKLPKSNSPPILTHATSTSLNLPEKSAVPVPSFATSPFSRAE